MFLDYLVAMSRRGPWTHREDEILKEIVEQQGALNWVKIAQRVQTRSPKQCRERYHQNLKPGLNHSPITPEEGAIIEKMVCSMGKRWAEIARALNNRSDNAVKNWWNGSMNRRQRLMRRATENHYARVHSLNTLGMSVPERSQAPSYHYQDSRRRHSHSSYPSCSPHGNHGHDEYREQQPTHFREATNTSRPAFPSDYPPAYQISRHSVDHSNYGMTSPHNYQHRLARSWDGYSDISGLPSPSTTLSSPIEPLEPPAPNTPWERGHGLASRSIQGASHSEEPLIELPPLRLRDSLSPPREIQASTLSHDLISRTDDIHANETRLPPIDEYMLMTGYGEPNQPLRAVSAALPRHLTRHPVQHSPGLRPPSSHHSPYSQHGDRYHRTDLQFLAR
ncbi:hypothetical protein F5Y11DRAFT_34441 [Daldinia sp. FL1419]|nr:hypothetical protein F5Y11DRAFT_34441 [Daldinia sp. FL1419]